MNTFRSTVVVATFAVLAAPAQAQFGFADFTLSWTEVDASTHVPVPASNGSLEPGEAARLSISVTFSPIGTVIQTGTGPGTVAGFAYTGFGLYSAFAGVWSDIGFPTGFAGSAIFNPNTQFLTQDVWQPHPALGNSPIPTNPISALWSVVWNPPNYQPRAVAFGLSVAFDQTPELFLRIGTDPQGNPLFETWEVMDWNFDSDISVPIVPAPSILAAALLAATSAARRRRQMQVPPP